MFRNFIGLLVAALLLAGLGTTAMGQLSALDEPDRGILSGPRLPGPIDDDDESQDGIGFGMKVAGTYLVEIQLTINGDPLPGPPGIGFQTLTIGGTQSSIDQGSFEGPPDGLIFPSGFGVWEKVAGRMVAIRSEIFGYQEFDGVALFPGRVFSVCQPSGTIEFTPDYNTAEGSFSTICFCRDPDGACGPMQDPLDPDAVPFFPPDGDGDGVPDFDFGGNFTFRRVSIAG